jgi:hypothetical protein
MVFRERLVTPRRGMPGAILERASGRRELRAGIDLDVAVSALVGAFYARYLAASRVPPGFARELVDIVWRGIARS